MKLFVCHLLLPPLLLLFFCHCFATSNRRDETDDQHNIYKLKESDPRIYQHRSWEHKTSNFSRGDFSCPSPVVIAPCTCTIDFYHKTYFDCTFVESVDQLVEVFQQDFPVKDLYRFSMENNSAINLFPSFMNGITFESVWLFPGPFLLEGISEQFLLDLEDTLKEFFIYNSKITTDFFPFSILSSMNQLDDLRFENSDIDRIPPIRAPKLTLFDVQSSLVELLVNGTFPIGIEPMTIWVAGNQIHTIEVGSIFFTDQDSIDSKQLIRIDLSRNQLMSLMAGTFPLRNGEMNIKLHSNQISSIEPGTFVLPASTDSLTISLDLQWNELTTVDEAVFGNMMPFVWHLALASNPLSCGCDIAWLIVNADFIKNVDYAATCADGNFLHELDPRQYIDLC